MTALLGRNGVGKTTTLRAILGLVARTRSDHVLGSAVSGWPTHRIVRLGIGYVPEDRDVFSGLTVGENLRLAERSRRRHATTRCTRSSPNCDRELASAPERSRAASSRCSRSRGCC